MRILREEIGVQAKTGAKAEIGAKTAAEFL
jgi:hypothetical protein